MGKVRAHISVFEGVGPDVKLEQVRVIEAPGVTHIKYRVGSGGGPVARVCHRHTRH